MPVTSGTMGHPVVSGYSISHSGFTQSFYSAPSGMNDSSYYAQADAIYKQAFINDYAVMPSSVALQTITFPTGAGGFVLDLAARGSNNPANFGGVYRDYNVTISGTQSTVSYFPSGTNVVTLQNVGQATNQSGLTPIGKNVVDQVYNKYPDVSGVNYFPFTNIAQQNATANNNVPVIPVIQSGSIPVGKYYKGDVVS